MAACHRVTDAILSDTSSTIYLHLHYKYHKSFLCLRCWCNSKSRLFRCFIKNFFATHALIGAQIKATGKPLERCASNLRLHWHTYRSVLFTKFNASNVVSRSRCWTRWTNFRRVNPFISTTINEWVGEVTIGINSDFILFNILPVELSITNILCRAVNIKSLVASVLCGWSLSVPPFIGTFPLLKCHIGASGYL